MPANDLAHLGSPLLLIGFMGDGGFRQDVEHGDAVRRRWHGAGAPPGAEEAPELGEPKLPNGGRPERFEKFALAPIMPLVANADLMMRAAPRC